MWHLCPQGIKACEAQRGCQRNGRLAAAPWPRLRVPDPPEVALLAAPLPPRSRPLLCSPPGRVAASAPGLRVFPLLSRLQRAGASLRQGCSRLELDADSVGRCCG